jgi:hypothetical protein
VNKLFLILKSVFAILVAIVQISCTDETAEQTRKKYQREYEQHLKTTICLVMEAHIQRYKEDPFNNSFGIQGYATYEEVRTMLYQHSKYLMKVGKYAYNYPKDFLADPIFPPINDIQKNCPELFKLFWEIPI